MLLKPAELRKRLLDAEAIVSKVYSKEKTDELNAAIKSTQEYLESKVSKFYAEFENLTEKSDIKLEELGKKQYKFIEKVD